MFGSEISLMESSSEVFEQDIGFTLSQLEKSPGEQVNQARSAQHLQQLQLRLRITIILH